MSTFVFGNNINTTLAAPLSSGATSVTLASSANLPTLGAGEIMALTFNDAATQTVFEIVHVTAIVGAVCTIVRGQDGTTAQNWNTGDYAFSDVTREILDTFLQTVPFSGSSITNPGYIKYANGLIDQFGTSGSISGNGGSTTITFATPFLSQVIGVTLGVDNNFGSNAQDMHAEYTTTLTTLTIYLMGGNNSSSATVSWRAIGT